jgi:hypothetical protein
MAAVLSESAKLYRNTGTYASPTWAEIELVKDLTLNMSKGDVDVTTRASGGFVERLDGLIDATIDFNILWDTADDDFTALRTAFTGKTAIEILCLDGGSATVGAQGLRASMMVASFTRNETLGEALMVDVSLMPRQSENPPAWHTVPSPP